MTLDPLVLRAPAKINLTLEILGRRKDGYHEIASVMQTVDLCDTLTFAPRADGQIRVECSDPALAENPGSNLVWRAARLLQQARQVDAGATIRLDKVIPTAAGLGGGSSDAAATLHGLDRLWALDLQAAELHNLAALLGSDVPFFLRGGTALAEGRGERITPLRPLTAGWFVLITQALTLPDKTRTVYSLLRPYEYSDGTLTRRVVDTLAAGGSLTATLLYNGLEDAAFRAFDTLAAGTTLHDALQSVIAAGGEFARVTGAGPSLFLYSPDHAAAATLAAAVTAAGLPAWVVPPLAGVADGLF
ncbi:MAG: 4-(cytidine 5'-diphospho)-2-C-methyl-D-erythritol kinase [Chloroflexota bacterium]|nr:4-(cytidine 5'-diphospho)-2-C-methyl-D-erythritol kinase [Chloroflexota bacterium]